MMGNSEAKTTVDIGCLLVQNFTLSKIVRFLSPFLFRNLLCENIINIFPFYFLSASKALIEHSGRQEGSYALKYNNYFYVSRTRIENSNSAAAT